MSTLEPPEDDVLAGLEAQLADIKVGEVEDVSKIPSLQLAMLVHECDQALTAMGQLLHGNPTTEEAREIHSRRAALLIEMAKRGVR